MSSRKERNGEKQPLTPQMCDLRGKTTLRKCPCVLQPSTHRSEDPHCKQLLQRASRNVREKQPLQCIQRGRRPRKRAWWLHRVSPQAQPKAACLRPQPAVGSGGNNPSPDPLPPNLSTFFEEFPAVARVSEPSASITGGGPTLPHLLTSSLCCVQRGRLGVFGLNTAVTGGEGGRRVQSKQ